MTVRAEDEPRRNENIDKPSSPHSVSDSSRSCYYREVGSVPPLIVRPCLHRLLSPRKSASSRSSVQRKPSKRPIREGAGPETEGLRPPRWRSGKRRPGRASRQIASTRGPVSPMNGVPIALLDADFLFPNESRFVWPRIVSRAINEATLRGEDGSSAFRDNPMSRIARFSSPVTHT